MAKDTIPDFDDAEKGATEAQFDPTAAEEANSRIYVLLILTAILAVNQLDRHVLNISLDAIGREFALSDTQLRFLSGFYSPRFMCCLVFRWQNWRPNTTGGTLSPLPPLS
jgi:hypothetical protein